MVRPGISESYPISQPLFRREPDVSQKKFLTAADIQEIYGIDEAKIQSLVDAGDLKALADRGTWKYRHDDLVSLIEQGRLQASKEMPTVDDVDFDIELGGQGEGEQVDFLELDEDALSGGSTVISSGLPQPTSDLQLSFTDNPAPSSSDVRVFEPTETGASDSDILMRGSSTEMPASNFGPSSSDVLTISGESAELAVPAETAAIVPQPEDSVSDVDVFAGLDDQADAEEALAFSEGDSGLTLETGDSGLTLETGDSGLTLETGDSGLTLETGDSGLTLDTGDSGLSLEVVPDDVAPAAPAAATQRMESIDVDDSFDLVMDDEESDSTRRMAVEERFADENQFSDSLDDSAPTAVIAIDDNDYDATSEFAGTLSGAIAAGESVEDLEVTDDLAAAIADDDDDLAAVEDEILDAEDEAFSDEFVGETGDAEDEEYLAPAKKAVPREPSWGALTSVMVIGAAALVGTNVWLIWEGMSTMWTGSEPSGPAAALISSISSMLG